MRRPSVSERLTRVEETLRRAARDFAKLATDGRVARDIGIGYIPGMEATANLSIRRRLMQRITAETRRRGLRQREAAALFRTTQPRISEIVRGKVDEFTIDALVNMLSAAGIPVAGFVAVPSAGPAGDAPEAMRRSPRVADPLVEAYKRDVDRSLLRASLERTPTERLAALQELQALAAELRSARRRERAR